MQKIHEIFYTAGLLEGEGCFGFYDCPVVQVHMTDLEPLQRLRRIMAPDVRIRTQNRRGNRKEMHILHFSGIRAIECMMTVYTLMSPRRQEKIREIIREWHNMKDGRHQTLAQNNRSGKFTSKMYMLYGAKL